jgi:sulfite reductase (ferredoxin)
LAFQRGTLSCTGSEFCKLAITETKLFSIRLARELDDRLPEFGDVIKLNVTGCPNSCGQHWIADVGLQGILITRDGRQIEGFDFFIGGGIGARSGIARRVGFRVPADDVPDVLERLFTAFCDDRRRGESFHGWTRRVGDDEVRAVLAGETSPELVST